MRSCHAEPLHVTAVPSALPAIMDGVAATRADMVEFSGVFDSWSAWLSTQLHSHASQHANFVSESTEEVTALRTKQQQLAHARQQNSKGTG